MELLDQYFRIQKEIHDYFGYKEDWVVIPLDDCRNHFWYLEDGDDSVHFTIKSRENLETIVANDFDYDVEGADGNDYYVTEIYTQRFLPKWVYETDDYTLICTDPHVDGNKFLSVFDNSNRVRVSS